MTTNDNPLLGGPFGTPFEVPPFDKIRTEHYEPAIDAAIDAARRGIEAIATNPEPPTFENTIVALERNGADLGRVLGVFGPMLSAMSSPEMMEVSLRVDPKLSEYSSAVTLDARLWDRVRRVYESEEATRLDGVDRRLLDETYRSFARNGASLEPEKKEELRQKRMRLSELTTVFGQNVLKQLNTITVELSPEEADGLPQHVLDQGAEQAAAAGLSEGRYLFTLHQPTYLAVMKYARRRDVRERFYRLYTSRNTSGEYSNLNIIREIAALRASVAAMLGYDTYADYSLENTMAHTPAKVFSLLDQLREAYGDAARAEVAELEEFARRSEGEGFTLMPWDYSYWFNLLRRERYDFDDQKLRPYFLLDNVIDGVFSLATRLYGVTFRENPSLPKYHEDVRAYEVADSDGTILGVLYTDFFPRETKQPGAWMTEFKGQWTDSDGRDSRPVISIVMNFTKPTASEPSLLTPGEVRTFLHEFGHSLHGLLTRVRYESLSGTNVSRDFVELPSQFNENFLTEREFLNSFARHYKTGEPIPAEDVARIIETSQFGAAYACYRQLSFGLLDMAWHTLRDGEAGVDDPVGFERRAITPVALLPEVDGAMTSPQFSHIFAGGYAAGYYSYKWSELLDADAFAVFKREGVFNPATARRFRTEILEKGNSEDPAELYRRFRGGEPTVDALLERDGIKPGE
ncbi:MAG: M3 family metallopeptidase [Clostridium sp.]|nr:M3 family metallopeptidase [Clostridium sp.]